MSTHDEYMTRRQARDLARRLARLERKTRSTAAAHADLRHSALDQGARIPVKDEQGITTAYVGSGPTGIEHVDGPVPEQPSAPFVDVGPRVVKVQSSGLDVNENPAPADLKHVEVHVAQDEVFEPSWSTFATNMDTANGSVTHSLPAGEWYVGLVWVTLSGKRSVMSEIVLAVIEPPVDAQDIQDTLDAAQEALDEYRDEVAAPRFQALEEGFVVHETNISDARDRLEAAESTLAPLPGRIESAERDVETAKEAAESAEARAVEASNNASNRLTNGGFELGLDHWDTTNVTLSNDAHTGTQAALIGAGGSLVPDASIPVSEGDVWDVSAYAKNGSALVVDVINSADNTVLESFTTSTASSWSETGRLRVEVPADVSYVNIRITGDGVLVDDVVLRDVTDVVRLERAATAARQTADQALAELELMRMAVDGEGGLKDRLTTAETTLETKADESALNRLDTKLAQLGWDVTKVWRQADPPPTGTTYEWANGAHASASVQRINGVEVARNEARNPSFEESATNSLIYGSRVTTHGRTAIEERVKAGVYSTIVSWEPDATQIMTTVQTEVDAHSGQWVAMSIWATSTASGDVYADGVISQRGSSNNHLSHHYQGNYRSIGRNEMTRLTYVIQADNPNVARVRAGLRFSGTAGTYSQPSGYAYLDAMHVVVADTQQAALDQIAEYFDGDSPDDREHDIWIDADGVPHFWLKGWGWAVLDDARIDQLQNQLGTVSERLDTAESDLETALEGPIDHARLRVGEGAFDEAFASKLIADHATIINAAMRNLSIEEKLLFAEAIGEQIWAELGVFDRLQAREGWIGGTLLADGAVTAEKITATRELITKIMGAEWAYIAQQLIVDGSILTRDLEALSAAIQSLTVTQRADIAQLWAKELWTALAVIEELQAEEAWITSAMISELTAEKVTVTEEFVGRVAELLHLVVDRIDANTLWADQTWQAAGYFGVTEGGQQNLIDGRGMLVRLDPDGEDERILFQAGLYGEQQIASYDAEGNVLYSLNEDGSAAVQHLTVANDPVFNGKTLQGPSHAPFQHPSGDQTVLGWMPRGTIAHHEHIIGEDVSLQYRQWGFLEVTHQMEAGRLYKLSVSPVTYHTTAGATTALRVRTADSHVWLDDQIIGETVVLDSVTNDQRALSGAWIYQCDTTGERPFLVELYNSARVRTPGNQTVHMWIEDLGAAPGPSGRSRNSLADPTAGGAPVDDSASQKQTYTTVWRPAWTQAYSHGGTIRATDSWQHKLAQGYWPTKPDAGLWTSMAGYAGATTSSDPTEIGQTITAALAGADIVQISVVLGPAYTVPSTGAVFRLHHHPATQPPNQYLTTPTNSPWIDDIRMTRGGTHRKYLDVTTYGPQLQSGALRGLGLAPRGAGTSTAWSGDLGHTAANLEIHVTYRR